MLSTLRWAGSAANANSLADPNSAFDPTLPCASGEDVARDALVMADVPKKLIERLEKKPQEIGPDCLFENAESILRFFEEDIVLHVVKQEVEIKQSISTFLVLDEPRRSGGRGERTHTHSTPHHTPASPTSPTSHPARPTKQGQIFI